jgi:hypothetical protein
LVWKKGHERVPDIAVLTGSIPKIRGKAVEEAHESVVENEGQESLDNPPQSATLISYFNAVPSTLPP